MTIYTNNTNIPLSMAVWLATDSYDYSDDPNQISATSLLKPIRAIVLARQNKELDKVAEISGLVASKMGTAIHDSIEASWLSDKLQDTLKALGQSDKVIKRIKVNPLPEELEEDTIPVYMEQRVSKDLLGFKISGKYDFVINGRLEDYKTT